MGSILNAEKVLIVIPARYNSNRIPGKVLEDLHGFPMIYWVYKRAMMSNCGPVVVATDHPRVCKVLENFEIPFFQTSSTCRNGTERIFEISKHYPHIKYFINVQGDEPLLNPKVISDLLSSGLNNVFKTAVSPIYSSDNNPNEVKVALSFNNQIRFASRNLIPFPSKTSVELYKIHGVYLYSRDVLRAFCEAAPGPLEIYESIEQLRCIENDIPLFGVKTEHTERSVDTQEDLTYMRRQPIELFFGV